MSKKSYKYKGKRLEWDCLKDKCPLCGKFVVLKKQKPEDGCIRIRFFKCTVCEFDSRNFEGF